MWQCRYGDPQKRSRLFVKAVKMDLVRMNFPTETHGGKDKDGNDLHTILRKGNVGHYEHDRTLTVREMARLQSLPDKFHFCGTRTQQLNGIGNAVPVNTAKAVGKSVLQDFAVIS